MRFVNSRRGAPAHLRFGKVPILEHRVRDGEQDGAEEHPDDAEGDHAAKRRTRRQPAIRTSNNPSPRAFSTYEVSAPSSGTPGSAAGVGCAPLMCPSRSGHGAYMRDYEKDPEQDAQCNAKTMKKTVVRHHPTLIIRSNARHGGLLDEGWPTAGAVGGIPSGGHLPARVSASREPRACRLG